MTMPQQGDLAWNPASFQDVLGALTNPALDPAALTEAIARAGGLRCVAPTWDADASYRVHLDPDANPQIQREQGVTWWGVVSFRRATAVQSGLPYFKTQVTGHEGATEASGKLLGPGGAIVLVHATGATPDEARRTASHAIDSAAAKLNQGVGLEEWLATIRAQENALASGEESAEQAAAGVPDGGAHGQHRQARRRLQGALGLPVVD